ncbi:hypothetical protein EGR_04760 [Echinococcus granulosus]|uniref:Uncharacterized protein n=1 Tax=Echinococcus granulosus TaxID=6210 RepID=W6UH68_ECHGR|nr:hypothetical protein EGR_04760 [Echinococcus granulosus]EUB60378.1 hypothetical protein EGR_04760 [Echinococcus granulosus]
MSTSQLYGCYLNKEFPNVELNNILIEGISASMLALKFDPTQNRFANCKPDISFMCCRFTNKGKHLPWPCKNQHCIYYVISEIEKLRIYHFQSSLCNKLLLTQILIAGILKPLSNLCLPIYFN